MDFLFSEETVGHDFSVKLSFHNEPVTGVWIVLVRGGMDQAEDGAVAAGSVTDRAGIARFYAVPRGKYWVRPEDGSLSPTLELQVVKNQKSAEPIKMEWPLTSLAVRSLRGRLMTSDALADPSLPLQYTRVELLDLHTGRLIETVSTDEEGNYRFTTVDPGLYVLRVSPRPAVGMSESRSSDMAIELDAHAGEAMIPEMKLLQSECGGVQLFRRIGADHWEQQ